jgi:hypothetical protein
MKIQPVSIESVNIVWPKIEPFFIRSLKEGGSGEYTIDQVKIRVVDGSWKVIVWVDEENNICGAAAIQFFNRPDARVGFVVLISGRMLFSENNCFEQLKIYMMANGATCMEGTARTRSRSRLWSRLGLAEKHRTVGVKL